MAYGIGEDPAISVSTHLSQVEYPIERSQLVESAEEGGAPPDVINLLKVMPRERYTSLEEAQRDLAEAARRFAMGSGDDDDPMRNRQNIGRDLVENAEPPRTRHP